MKKILFHVPQLGSGGIEKLVEQWYPVAKKNGIEYVFTVMVPGGKMYDYFQNKGNKIYTVKEMGQVGVKNYIKQFYDIAKKEQIGGMHVPAAPTASLILLAGFLAGCKMRIMHAHTNLYIKEDGKEWDKKHLKAYMLLNNLFSNIKCTGASEAAEYCFGKKSHKAVLIRNGIDIEKFTFRQETRDRERERLGLGNCFVLGSVGRFAYQKNQEFVIRILKELMEKYGKQFKLLLLGEGEDEPKLRELVKELDLREQVLFLGTTNNLMPYYCAMDAFVFPSRYEGLGIAAVEAQCTGVMCYLSEQVPDDAIISERVLKLSIDDDASLWAETIYNGDNSRVADAWKDAKSNGYDEKQSVQDMIKVYLQNMR